MIPFLGMQPRWPELSDLVVDFDPSSLERRPVRKDDVLARLEGLGNHYGLAIARRLPATDGVLDPDAMDRELVACHYEIQRLALELQQGPRMLGRVRGALEAVARTRPDTPLRVVDVGCGIGYVLRWMAAHIERLPPGVDLVGADFNPALIARARALADAESLPVRFVVANAFVLPEPASVFISSGVLHHVPEAHLPDFFAGQADACVSIHADFQASPLGPLGAWLMHAARMERPLALHDGVLSAVRAYPGDVLLDAARRGLPDRVVRLVGTHLWGPIPRAMHALVIARPDVAEALPW